MATAARLGAGICLAIFLITTGLVQSRVLVPTDYAIATSLITIDSGPLDTVSAWAATLLAFEACIIYAGLLSLVLWRKGAGLWALAPYAFVGLTALELLMKLTLDQPGVPPELQRIAPYPFTVVHTGGSFPSGHAIRSAFLCVLAGVLLWRPGLRVSPILAAALGILALGLGFTRLYLGYHWTTDVIAGLALGTGLALLVASPVADRIQRQAVA